MATTKSKKRRKHRKPINFNSLRFDTHDGAEYLNLCAGYTLKRSRSTGSLLGRPSPEYSRIGNRVFYERSILDEWLRKYAIRQANTAQNVTQRCATNLTSREVVDVRRETLVPITVEADSESEATEKVREGFGPGQHHPGELEIVSVRLLDD
jgi:hypothetical protein